MSGDRVGPPEPDENGQYKLHELLEYVETERMARAEALIDAWGVDALAMMRFLWH
jgi:hypothetical protein